MHVALVQLSGSTNTPALPDDLFIEAPAQPALIAEKILPDCLVRFGPLPAILYPAKPTVRETDALRRIISRYRTAFGAALSLTTRSSTIERGPRNNYEG